VILAVLGVGLVPADTPVLRADDLGALRGDGVFETVHVRRGEPWLLDAHLDRMARSARRLELPLPARADLEALAAQACAAWGTADEGALRLVCTRGPEGGGGSGSGRSGSGPGSGRSGSGPTVYATLGPIAPAHRRARRDGITVRTLPLAVPATGRTGSPWLLAGAKTLSYAVNMACLRWAASVGADDVLWVSTEGYALEAPTSTLVWLAGGTLYTVPPGETGILAGTTAAHLLSRAGELGWTAAEHMVRPAELADADGVWLASSVRGVAEVRKLDDTPLRPSPDSPSPGTARLQKLLGYGIPE
jgi:4-amino-4-deoxychorismate lyase